MWRKVALYALGILIPTIVGGIAGFLILANGFITMNWNFPGSWSQLNGLPEAPQELVAVQVPSDDFVVRTVSGKLFLCIEQECTETDAQGTESGSACGKGNTPGVVTLFPYLLSSEIRTSLACEVAYLDTAHTVYLVHTTQGESWFMPGINFFPTDSAIIAIGILGGLSCSVILFLMAGFIALIVFLGNASRARKQNNS